jgi:hypothetical protein
MRNIMIRHRIVSRLPLAALTAVAVAGSGSAALAHAGDHSHMTFGELADHLATSLDHRLTLVAVVLFVAVTVATVLLARRPGPGRLPETPET